MTALSAFLPELRVDFAGAPEPVLLTAVRSACIEFCDKSDYVQADHATIKIAPNARSYALSAPSSAVLISSIVRARYDGKDVPVLAETELDDGNRATAWRSTTGDVPEHIYRPATAGTAWNIRPHPYTTHADATGNITAATQADPVVLTSVAHGRATGERLWLADVVGMTELNDAAYVITVVDVDTFSLDGIDGSAFTAYTSGGTWSYNDGTLDVRFATKPTRDATTVADEVYEDFYEAILLGARRRLFGQPGKAWYDPRTALLLEEAFREQIRDARTKRTEGDADRSRARVILPTAYIRKRHGRRDTNFDYED